MLNLNDIEFTTHLNKDKSSVIRAQLKVSAEMHLSPAVSSAAEQKEFENHVKEGLSRAIAYSVYGDLKEYMYLMQSYMRTIAPDPRYNADGKLLKKIEALETRFNLLLG